MSVQTEDGTGVVVWDDGRRVHVEFEDGTDGWYTWRELL